MKSSLVIKGMISKKKKNKEQQYFLMSCSLENRSGDAVFLMHKDVE